MAERFLDILITAHDEASRTFAAVGQSATRSAAQVTSSFAEVGAKATASANEVDAAWKSTGLSISTSAEKGAAAATAANEKVAVSAKASAATMGGAFGGLKSTLTGLFSGALALGGLDLLTKGAVDYGHQIQQLTSAYGINSQAAARLKAETDLVGVSISTVVPTIARLTKAAGDSSSSTAKALAAYGISVAQFRSADISGQLGMLSDAYVRAGDSGKQFIADVLGGRGTKIAPLLAEYGQLQHALQGTKFPVPSPADIISMEKFQLQMQRLVTTIEVDVIPFVIKMKGEIEAALAVFAVVKIVEFAQKLKTAFGTAGDAAVAFRYKFAAVAVAAVEGIRTIVSAFDSNVDKVRAAGADLGTAVTEGLSDELAKVAGNRSIGHKFASNLSAFLSAKGPNAGLIKEATQQFADYVSQLIGDGMKRGDAAEVVSEALTFAVNQGLNFADPKVSGFIARLERQFDIPGLAQRQAQAFFPILDIFPRLSTELDQAGVHTAAYNNAVSVQALELKQVQPELARMNELLGTQIDLTGTTKNALDQARTAYAQFGQEIAGQLNFTSNAVSAYIDAQKNAAAAAQQAAAAQKQAAQSLAQAQQQAADTAVQGAQAQKQAAQDVASAEQALRTAEDAVPAALDRVTTAQQALNAARQEAIRNLQDMRSAEAHGALGVREAQLSLAEAKKALKELQDQRASSDVWDQPDVLAYREAVLRVQEAELALSDAQRTNKRNHEDLAKAEKDGVNGSDAVTSAQADLAAAYQGVTDAQSGVREATKKLAEAQAGQVQAARDAAQANADAARQIAAAQADMAKATQDAQQARALANRDSVAGLKSSLDAQLAQMRSFSGNLRTIAQDGGRGAQELVQQLLALGPAGVDMARKLVDSGRTARQGIERDLGHAFSSSQDAGRKLERALTGGFNTIARAIIIATSDAQDLGRKLAAFDGKHYRTSIDISTHYQDIGSPLPGTPAFIFAPRIAAATGFEGWVGPHAPVQFTAGEGNSAEYVSVTPAGKGSHSSSPDRMTVIVRPDRRRFTEAQDYEQRFGGP